MLRPWTGVHSRGRLGYGLLGRPQGLGEMEAGKGAAQSFSNGSCLQSLATTQLADLAQTRTLGSRQPTYWKAVNQAHSAVHPGPTFLWALSLGNPSPITLHLDSWEAW